MWDSAASAFPVRSRCLSNQFALSGKRRAYRQGGSIPWRPLLIVGLLQGKLTQPTKFRLARISSRLSASLYAGAALRNDCLYPLESQVDILKATAPQIVLVDHEIDAPSLAPPIHAGAVTAGIQLK
jgi:hypothetical protein